MYSLMAMGGAVALTRVVVWNERPLTIVEGTSKVVECAISTLKILGTENKFLKTFSDWSVFLYMGKRCRDWSSKDSTDKWLWQKDLTTITFYSFLTGNALCSFVVFLNKFTPLERCANVASKIADLFMGFACITDLKSQGQLRIQEKLDRYRNKQDWWSTDAIKMTLPEFHNYINERAQAGSALEKVRLGKILEHCNTKENKDTYCLSKTKTCNLIIENEKIKNKKALFAVVYDISYISVIMFSIILPLVFGVSFLAAFSRTYSVFTRLEKAYLATNMIASTLELSLFLVDNLWKLHKIEKTPLPALA